MSQTTHRRHLQRQIDHALKTRSCGTCNACCIVLGVEEIGKSVGERCKHLVEKGCGIYEKRPPSCREYHCLWRSGMLDGPDRPDRLGVVFDCGENEVIFAREFRPDALDEVRSKIGELAKKLVVVLIREGDMRRVIGPQDRVIEFMERGRRRLQMVVED